MLERSTGFGPEAEASPANWATVFQKAKNLLPPEDYEPPPDQPVESQMGRYASSEHFIKGSRSITVTAMGTTDLEANGFYDTSAQQSLPERSYDGTPNKPNCKEFLRSYLCCCK